MGFTSFAPTFIGPRHRLRERLLLRLFLEAAPGRRVLNAGAGQGSFSALLERMGFVVTSLDSDEGALSLLDRRAGGDVVRADVADMPFDDCSFDAAVLGEVLEHIQDDASALSEVVRVICPGGVVAISVPGNPAHFGPSDVWAGHVRRYTRAALLSVAEAADLRVERCVAWGFPCSTLYHRYLYEPRLERVGPKPVGRSQRLALAGLTLLLKVDRFFVGVERGSLGYLLVGRRRDNPDSPPLAKQEQAATRRVRGGRLQKPRGGGRGGGRVRLIRRAATPGHSRLARLRKAASISAAGEGVHHH